MNSSFWKCGGVENSSFKDFINKIGLLIDLLFAVVSMRPSGMRCVNGSRCLCVFLSVALGLLECTGWLTECCYTFFGGFNKCWFAVAIVFQIVAKVLLCSC